MKNHYHFSISRVFPAIAYNYYFDDELWLEVYSSDVEFQNAKQCALITVNKIIEAITHIYETYEYRDFWLQVKKEIEEM